VRPRGARGFTLIELLVTLSVTTIGLIGLLSLHLSIARGNDNASRSAEAQQIAAAAIEELRAQSIQTMLTTIAATPTSSVTGRNNLVYQVTRSSTVLGAVSNSLVLIRVVASWAEDGAALGLPTDPGNHAIALEVIRTMEERL
jgi:prepilin-type N-terminal cleavage/methylation domain-containing protein